MTDDEYKKMLKEAAKQFKEGIPLFGKEGVFHRLIEDFLNTALEAEMDEHIAETKPITQNRRNGKMPKTVKCEYGEFDVSTPRDRDGTFEPELIKKRQTILAEGLADKIISLYASGMSMSDIQQFLSENYGADISKQTISNITERVWDDIKAWRSRSLNSIYAMVWMDAVHYKVRAESGRTETRAIYNVLGIDQDGCKELLGMYISASEGANFWLDVLTDLQNRGVQDILIACVDGLTGFPEAIASVFPKTEVQLCVIHQIRNSVKNVASKNKKEFTADLKKVYAAVNKEAAEMALDALENKWGDTYPVVIKSWRNKWDLLSNYFKYTADIRRIIYTTNTVEGYHRQLRKVTKTKGVFPNDDAVYKLVYLAYINIQKKWTKPLANWPLTVQQLSIMYGDRFPVM